MDGIDTAAIRSMRDFVARAQAADALCDEVDALRAENARLRDEIAEDSEHLGMLHEDNARLRAELDQAAYDRDSAREAGLVYLRQRDAMRAENARLTAELDSLQRQWQRDHDELLAAYNKQFARTEEVVDRLMTAETELAVLRGQITAVQKVLAYRADKDQTLNTIRALLSAGSGAALTGDDHAGDRPGHQFYGSGGSQWGHPNDMHKDCGRHDGEDRADG